ncbi:MAG: hypothetical protein QE275_03820 [Actinomycetota bacterium]|jgi:hypothetical protein|nr:hypothetical protein [Actinomycetota bacterium]
MLEAFASGFLVFAYTATALFQLALVFGAPMGEYAYGGQMPGKLPIPYRVASAVSFLLLLAIAGHYLAQLGLVPKLLSDDLNQWVNWGLIGFAAAAAVMNNITRSVKEKRLWGSTTIAMLIAAIVVAF